MASKRGEQTSGAQRVQVQQEVVLLLLLLIMWPTEATWPSKVMMMTPLMPCSSVAWTLSEVQSWARPIRGGMVSRERCLNELNFLS